MDAGVVGGAFLSATLQVLFDRMASQEFVDFVRGKRLVHKLLEKLKRKMSSAKAVLIDAEEKQIGNPAVKQWLDDLNEAIYEAEDLVEQINDEILRYKLKDESTGSSSKKVLNFLTAKFSSFNRKVEKKIVVILDKLNDILEQKESLGLREVSGYRPSGRLPATSLVEASGVFGRNGEKEAIVNSLLRSDDIGNNISVIPIVGMAGIGKTTLAQLIFNDIKVKDRFDFREWFSVSHQFDVLSVTKEILLTIADLTFTSENLNLHQVKLEEALKGKRFLIVLDDVWNEDDLQWDEFKKPFMSGAHGSSIIVTTRSDGVASVMRNVPSYRLKTMSEEDSWELFVKHAFNSANPYDHPKLEEIGRQIVQKCNGIPLAVKSLGILLGHQSKLEEWENILNSDMWELENNNILPALWLSYHYLPSHLKRCFAYCSIFPKEYEINKEDLIKLWMAEDLLQPKNNKRIEEVGEEYVNNLLSRSLFQQPISLDDSSNFTMHELMNDLATFITREFCLRMDDRFNANKLPSKVRHVSHVKACAYDLEKHKALSRSLHLRTFLSSRHFGNIELQNVVVANWLPRLTCLRALSLSGYSITELPASIGKLKLLRYLDLSNTKIKELPAAICTLYNLRSLLLKECVYLKSLPTDIGKLINLRHLHITDAGLEEMPLEMVTLKGLQTLTDFVLGKDSGHTIKSLRDLQHLHESLHISGLENVEDVEDVLVANLKDKKYLTELGLVWGHDDGFDASKSQKDRDILSGLQPNTNIKILEITYYRGEQFPNWLGDHSFCNIEKIQLSGCTKCCQLPPFGLLPFLKQLIIMGLHDLLKIGDEFYHGDCPATSEPFRCLELLSFIYMEEWQEWSFIGGNIGGAFPQLKRLVLEDCPKLVGCISLPATMESFHISGCDKLEFFRNA